MSAARSRQRSDACIRTLPGRKTPPSRFAGGKLAEDWVEYDRYTLFCQKELHVEAQGNLIVVTCPAVSFVLVSLRITPDTL